MYNNAHKKDPARCRVLSFRIAALLYHDTMLLRGSQIKNINLPPEGKHIVRMGSVLDKWDWFEYTNLSKLT